MYERRLHGMRFLVAGSNSIFRLVLSEMLLKRVIRQTPFLSFVRYIYPRHTKGRGT